MNAQFVHGMGRSSLSWLPTLARFRAKGIGTYTFGYNVTTRDFASIVHRLVKSLIRLSSRGEYVVIGHSLGGVLLRAAIAELPAGTPLPKILFLLGSPISASTIAMRLRRNFFFRSITRDSGRLLGAPERMLSVPESPVPTIAIIGTRGLRGQYTPFGQEPNDGLVSESEARAEWLTETVRVPVIHTLLPSSKQVSQVMLERISRRAGKRYR